MNCIIWDVFSGRQVENISVYNAKSVYSVFNIKIAFSPYADRNTHINMNTQFVSAEFPYELVTNSDNSALLGKNKGALHDSMWIKQKPFIVPLNIVYIYFLSLII